MDLRLSGRSRNLHCCKIPVSSGPHGTPETNHNTVPGSNSIEPSNHDSLLTSVPSLTLGFVTKLNAGPRVHNGRLLNDQTVAVQLGNVASRVGEHNLIDLIGVQPDLALSALEDGSGEALLQFQRN